MSISGGYTILAGTSYARIANSGRSYVPVLSIFWHKKEEQSLFSTEGFFIVLVVVAFKDKVM